MCRFYVIASTPRSSPACRRIDGVHDASTIRMPSAATTFSPRVISRPLPRRQLAPPRARGRGPTRGCHRTGRSRSKTRRWPPLRCFSKRWSTHCNPVASLRTCSRTFRMHNSILRCETWPAPSKRARPIASRNETFAPRPLPDDGVHRGDRRLDCLPAAPFAHPAETTLAFREYGTSGMC